MELEKILQKANNINTKEEKLTFLLDNIWQTMYDGSSKKNLDTEILKDLTTNYIKCSFDAENTPVDFVKMPKNEYGGCNIDNDGITLNELHYHISENGLSDMNTYTRFLCALSHELTHHNDINVKKRIEYDPRFSTDSSDYSKCLTALGKLCNRNDYIELGTALYLASNDEIIARKTSHNFIDYFAKLLRKMTDEKLCIKEDAISHIDEYRALLNIGYSTKEAEKKANYSSSDKIAKDMHEAIDNIEKASQMIKDEELDIPLIYDKFIDPTLTSAKNDFFNVCNKYISGQSTKEELDIFNPYYMSELLTKPEFFNKEIGEALYERILYDKELNNATTIGALGQLCSIKELKNIPEDAREIFIDNYKNYKNFTQKQKNNSKCEK